MEKQQEQRETTEEENGEREETTTTTATKREEEAITLAGSPTRSPVSQRAQYSRRPPRIVPSTTAR
jgi:hypothetical protein